MTPGTKLTILRAAFVTSLVLPGACTENPASRTLAPAGKDAGASTGGSGARPATGGTGGSFGGTGGAAGGPTVDPCLPERCEGDPACVLDQLEQIETDFCRIYRVRCPDQPADVMMERGEGDPIPAELGAPSTATRPQLTEAQADDLYSIEKALEAGGVYTVSYSGTGAGGETAAANAGITTGAGGEAGESSSGGVGGEGGAVEPLGERTLSYESVGDWDPRGPIEDVNKIVPGLVVDPNGNPEVDGTYQKIQDAIGAAVVVAGCPRVFIKVMPGTYREKITVPAKTSSPPVTLYSADRDPSKVVIVRGDSAAGDEAMGRVLTIHQSATFTNSLPQPFQARNLTIANDYVAGTWPGDEGSQTAVALLSQADKAMFDNVRILGHRNALYVKSTGANEVSRVYFRNCYIEGDEDIILGRGAAVIDQCRIHSLGDRVSGGAIAAPSTRVDNPHGILIVNSELTADARVSGVYLGHTWYEGDTEEAVGKAIVRNSILGAHIRAVDPWAPTLRATPQDPTPTSPVVLYTSDDYYRFGGGLIPPEVFLAEFGNSGPGAAQ